MNTTTIIIYGPTASGKSALALEWALARNGTVINSDSMQIYQGLPILTAIPSQEDQNKAPHALYGYVDPAASFSANSWVKNACIEIRACWQRGQLPIVVGGTGLYMKALLQGFSPIPDISPDIRNSARETPLEKIRQVLETHDPEISARLKPNDSQRLTRAYEVLMQTGKPLSFWQSLPLERPLPEADFELYGLSLPREMLYARCDARLDTMIAQGGLQELSALLKTDLPDHAPIMRAVGVPELTRYIRGETSLADAITKAKQSTRNYAKRQVTWLRGQFLEAKLIEYPYK